ncbi:MAG TPA: RNA polymerase sigma factor [Acidimicrobiales bacterium]|nr:RNA polymerase sigma factor [Acidimicrobiales bacterium]
MVGAGQRAAVRDARQGDEDAWEHLYRQVYPRLRAYLVRRVGPNDAEDAVNETMARAVAGIDGFRFGPAGFDGWVFGIARNVTVEHYRQAGRRQRQAMAGQQVAVGTEPLAVPGERLERQDDRERVRRQFLRLSPAEQEVLELRVVAGLSAEEVAAVLGKRPGAVRTAQSRALEHLRRLVGDDGG